MNSSKKVLVIGHGGRGYAIAEALKRGGATVCAWMGQLNPGIEDLCEGRVKVGKLNNFKEMGEYATAQKIDFAVVSPEAPLTDGIVNALNAQDINVVGPTIECAQLEGSKVFMRELCKKYNIESNIKFQIFTSMEGIDQYIDEVGKENVVVKPDGLTGGKGVKVWGDHLNSKQDIFDYCEELFTSGGHVLIEENLIGQEFTYICYVDGKKVVGSPLVQDNKRAYNDDKGPNTGGMGSYSMANHLMPFITQEEVDYANAQMTEVVKAVKDETRVEYKGFLYGQFMKVKNGIKLVEFNIRFGDPEAINILPIMKSNFVDICQQILDGNLQDKVEFEKKATVVKYLVPEGYPTSPKRDLPLEIDTDALDALGTKLYYASVYKKDGVIYTSSSRAIGVLGVADTLEEAERIAEEGCSHVKGDLFHRTDVGTQKVLNQRIEHMKRVLES